MKKRFVTIFPICENIHLTKDLGQIPFFLHKTYGYKSSIVSYKNSDNYSNLNGEVNGLTIEFIENTGRLSFLEKGVLKYIRKNAKNIDILNLYIFSKFTFVYGILYKILNNSQRYFNHRKHIVFKYLEKKFLEKVNLITIENSIGEQLVKEKYPSLSNKIMYLPVGVNDLFLSQHFKDRFKTFDQKENIILTVGRIGEGIKNNEMMLRALSQINLGNWKMVFVGAINPDFKPYLENWHKSNPELKDKIIYSKVIYQI